MCSIRRRLVGRLSWEEETGLRPHPVLVAEGEPGSWSCSVVTGSLELRWGAEGCERFGPGDVIGLGALLSDEHLRHGTARALEACEVLEMNRERFLFAVQETPMFAIELMAGLASRLRRLEE